MKKIIIIIVIICFLITIGIIGYIYFNNSIVTMITLDINPSIEINLDRNEVIKSIKALNEDAKEVISNNLEGKKFEESLNILTKNIIDKGYIEDRQVTIIVYSNGVLSNNDVSNKLKDSFGSYDIHTEIIMIDNITKEDKELANKYNITFSKAAYINSIIKDNNLEVDTIINKTINELKEAKEHGVYCEDGYFLDGTWCYKEASRENAKIGMVCPEGSYDYNGKCLEEVGAMEGDLETCPENFKRVENDCIEEYEYDAYGKCEEGEDERGGYCIEKKYIADAYEFCRDPGRTLYDHKCLATKPSINGGCLNGDMYLNGKCVNTRDDYYMAEWKCPNGQVKSNADGSLVDDDTKCYEDIKKEVSSYYCERNDTLVGNKCKGVHKEGVSKEMYCPSGYTKLENGRCVNLNKDNKKVEGYYCEGENVKLKDNMCIIYTVVEAKFSN